ncbi:MAG: ABC transporter permease [Thaumarchaeota archaeon]|nr:ABC transporter permease [Nitrososphaerota archaeon]
MESPVELGKVWAMTRRDMNKWATYKTQATTSILGGLLGIVSWGLNATFVNRLVPDYNTNYVSFLIVGVLISSLILPLSQGIQGSVSPFTLESILMTGLKAPTFILGTVLWPYILSVVLFLPQLVVGIVYFHATLSVNPVSFVLALVISTTIVFSIAMVSTAFRIVTKTSDPVSWSLAIAASLFSGMTFPVSHLNDYVPGLSTVSWFLPQTWVYHIVRLSTLENASILDANIAISFLIAMIFAVVLLPLAFYVFRWGLNRAKRDGTLGHF